MPKHTAKDWIWLLHVHYENRTKEELQKTGTSCQKNLKTKGWISIFMTQRKCLLARTPFSYLRPSTMWRFPCSLIRFCRANIFLNKFQTGKFSSSSEKKKDKPRPSWRPPRKSWSLEWFGMSELLAAAGAILIQTPVPNGGDVEDENSKAQDDSVSVGKESKLAFKSRPFPWPF